MKPEIIYEDNDIIVCYKPAGTATETKRIGQQDMVSCLKNYRAGNGGPPYIGLVHRLDQPVEGLLVFGKTREAAAGLAGQVRERGIGKHYCAVGERREDAEGNSAPGNRDGGEGTVTLTDYLLFDRRSNLSSVVSADVPQAKKAVLEYRMVSQNGNLVSFDITLHTGRHHQIRVQMAHHGFPLLGDRKYAGKESGGVQLALCAYRLRFVHPVTEKEMDFSVEPRNPAFSIFK